MPLRDSVLMMEVRDLIFLRPFIDGVGLVLRLPGLTAAGF